MNGEEKKEEQLVWVKDKAGNEYLCPLSALQDPNDVSEEVLQQCLNSAKEAIGAD